MAPDDPRASTAPQTPAVVPAASRRSDRALVPADPLQAYMHEVRQYPLMSREEEGEVARSYQNTQEPGAAFRLVTSNLRLVVKIAMEYRHTRIPTLDLVQEGNVGLMMAVKKFDPERGVRFGSYAQWWIRAYVLKYLMDNYALVKVGTTQAQRKLFYNLKKERARLEQLGISPTTEALADALSVRESDVVEMQKRLSASAEVSIHAPLRSGEKGEVGDLIPGPLPDAEKLTARAQLNSQLNEKFANFRKTLNERSQFFWDTRLVAEEPWTLQKLGDQFGVSRERARQIEAQIVRQLKEFLRKEIHDLEDLDLAFVGD